MKSQAIIKKVAKETGINEETVNFIVNHAWKSIEDAFRSGKYRRIIFTNLMTFKLSSRVIRSYLYNMVKKLKVDPNNEKLKELFRLAWTLKNKL